MKGSQFLSFVFLFAAVVFAEEPGSPVDSKESVDVSADSLCDSVPSGEIFLFPYPGDCTKYFECYNGVRTTKNCDSGLWFNEAIQACDHPDTSGCNNIVCPPDVVDFFPDYSDCSKYYECYHGTPELNKCPSDLWFSAAEKRCVMPEESGCGQYSTSVRPTWTTPTDHCWGVLPGRKELRPYPGDCNRFIECEGSHESVLHCPYGLYFNSERQMCDLPFLSGCDDTTGTPDPYSTTPADHTTPHGHDDPRCANGNADYWPDIECDTFVECWQGHGYILQCPSGLYFDSRSKKCVNPSDSDCGITTHTPDPDTTTREGTVDPDCVWPSEDHYLFPYPGDCTKYLECWEGEKIVEDCPPGLWFNAELMVCDYPYHSGCRYHQTEFDENGEIIEK